MLLCLLSLAYAGRLVEVSYQEGRLTKVSFSEEGLDFEAEVRDVCHYWIHNLWYFERVEEWERPCSEWRPMQDTDPLRSLLAQPRDESRPIKGPQVEGRHAVAVDVTVPSSLRGSVWGAAFVDGSWRVKADALGAALVLGDLVGDTVERLSLRVHADAYIGEQPLPVQWRATNRPELIDHAVLRMDQPLVEQLGAAWRCEGLTALHPDDFLDLTGDLRQQVAYLAERMETCPQAVAAQAPQVCSDATERVTAAVSVEGLGRAHGIVEPIAEHCGPDYEAALQATVATLYAQALDRGRLDQCSALVDGYGALMGETWNTEARAQVDQMIRDTIPNRFDWAIQNRAREQAQELIELYGPVLGETWTAQAERRLTRI